MDGSIEALSVEREQSNIVLNIVAIIVFPPMILSHQFPLVSLTVWLQSYIFVGLSIDLQLHGIIFYIVSLYLATL